MKSFAAKTLLALALGFAVFTGQAALIYSNTNSVSDQGLVLTANDGVWFGDEVILAGTERYMTGFSFEYWSSNTTSLTVDVALYLNDGPVSPSTPIYQLSGITLNPDTASALPYRGGVYFDYVLDFGGTPLFINGNQLTLAVNFHYSSGLAGMTMYNAPDVGTAYDDFWLWDGSSWNLVTNNVINPVNFGMQIEAVPEPSAFSLLILGALMAVGFRRCIGRK